MNKTLIFTLLILLTLHLATATDYKPNNALNPTGNPLNTTIIPSNDVGWSYESNGLYEAHFKENPTSGQIVRFESGGAYITLQPMALNWRNDLNQLQQIAMVQSVTGTPQGNTMRYLGAYGPTTHLEYTATDTQLKENIKLENKPPEPSQYIIDGGNAALETNFIFGTNAFTIEINGEQWDKTTTKTTSNEVTIKNAAGDTLYTLPPPIAIDANGDTIIGTYNFKKSGVSLYISHRTPKTWLDNAAYPVTIDPTFTVDYNPIPGVNLKGAAALTLNDSNFINIDVTSKVSDDNDATTITLYKEREGFNDVAFHDKDSNDLTAYTTYDDDWYTPELNVKKISDASQIIAIDEPFTNGMKITIKLKLKETQARGTYYLTNGADTITYGTTTFTAAATPMVEYTRTITLANIVGGATTLFLHGKDLSGDKKIYVEQVFVTDPTNTSTFSGHWLQTYTNLSNWYLKVRKTTSGSVTTRTYAYQADDLVQPTVNATAVMNGIGWFYVPINTLLNYEKNTAGLNYTQLRFFSDNTASFSEFRLMQQTNDTEYPSITNCTVNTSIIACGGTARYSCIITDDNGVNNATFTINSVEYEAMKNETLWYVDVSPIGYATTNYTLTLVKATDIFSKTNTTTQDITVLYNCTLPSTPPPRITNCTVEPSNITCDSTATYSCIVIGNYTINSVDFTIDNTTYEGLEGTNNTWYVQLSFTGEERKNYTLTLVNATDILAQNNATIQNVTATYNCAYQNSSMNCLYDPYPELYKEQQFVCTLTDAENKTYKCYGITKSPIDGSIYDINPRQSLVNDYGPTGGVTAEPPLAYNQVVKIDFTTKRLANNQSVTYQALCINTLDNTDQLTFDRTLSPTITEAGGVLDATVSLKNNATYVVLGIFTLFFLAGLAIWFAQKLGGRR